MDSGKIDGISAGPGRNGRTASIAHPLRHPLADPLGHLFVDLLALLLRHLVTHLDGVVRALALLNRGALLLGHGTARPTQHIPTLLVGHLTLPLLGHINAGVVGVGAAGAGDGDPHLGGALALPVVLAVLLVLGAALSLGVGVHLRPVGRLAHLLVDSVAHLLGGGAALLPGHVDAGLLDLGLALVGVHGHAFLGLRLYVVGAPHSGHLGTALDGRSSIVDVVVVVGTSLRLVS